MKLKDLFESTEKSVSDLGIEYDGIGDFRCFDLGLTSLEGSPEHITGRFHCYDNKLTSLEGGPKYVDGTFNCSVNKITSLEGSPERVKSHYFCYGNNISSFKNVHTYIKEIDGKIDARHNEIKSHVLGLLLIKGVTHVELDNKQVEEILNHHFGKGRAGMLQAQEELIEAGLEEFAQL